jgi:hypothetical protein
LTAVETMRAVWSFWSKPFLQGQAWCWREPIHHLLAWGLSFRLAQAHYPRTALVTDSRGAALLVDALGLPFADVRTDLDALQGADPSLWMLGKLTAYGLQSEPFVHLDTDVFLWRPLPGDMTSAPAFAQHMDEFPMTGQCGPRIIEDAFARAGLSLPAEWEWVRSHHAGSYREANCGIFGGTNTAFIRYYAQLALDLALNPGHSPAWASIPDRFGLNPTVEQFVFTACADYHRFNPGSPHRGLYTRYLFPSAAEAYDPAHARRAGYTHLLGDAKQHPHTMARLEARVRTEDPVYYARCEAVLRGSSQPGT